MHVPLLGRPRGERDLDAKLLAHENNFDALRLLFAVLVLFSHCYALLGRPDELFARSLGYDTGGGFAVAGFFVISGFLVTRSALSSDVRRYAAGRVLRIVPALTVVSILSVLVVGPLTTRLSLIEYFSRPATWSYLSNALIFPVRFVLPGVFAGNPLQTVNGSLWTLPIETAMYIGLPLLVGMGLFSRAGIVGLLAAVSASFYLGTAYWGLSWEAPGPSPIPNVQLYSLLKFGVFFVAGAFLYVHRGRVPLSPALAAAVLILWAVLHHTPAGLVAWYLGLPYLVFFFGFQRGRLGAFFARHGDLSYGVYLYAFPMQQSVIYALGPQLGVASLTLASLAPTLVLAFCSWHLVERPALTWKARWSGPRRAMAA
jgi:peptidoglycan/LPS O-acetylase OafA/YrhL